MRGLRITALALVLASGAVLAQSRIVCTPTAPGEPIAAIWPEPYLSTDGQLCFDVQSWPEYSGQNCVRDGGQIAWTGLVIVTVDGASMGRDSTSFRVDSPTIGESVIEYRIDWSRGRPWAPMQHVKINRLSGVAVSYFQTQHGGEPYQCRLAARAI